MGLGKALERTCKKTWKKVLESLQKKFVKRLRKGL